MSAISEGTILWQPSEELQQHSNLRTYMDWLSHERGLHFGDYRSLWEWSTSQIGDFWQSIWDYFQVQSSHPPSIALESREMPGARWFPGTSLNYVEHIFRNATPSQPALLFQSETHPLTPLSWEDLQQQVASTAAALRALGVGLGDRVVGYLPNIPEALVAFLATASIGAIWSGCSPDMGEGSVLDRFRQIEPRVLFAVDGYVYGGKRFERSQIVQDLQRELPTLKHTILVPYLDPAATTNALNNTVRWDDLLQQHATAQLSHTPVPFDHPLWILYSSGTTGLPKPIVQGHGGILLEQLKNLGLQMDLKPNDRFFWFTTTGWMMWNMLISGLLLGSTVLLYDGSPAAPDIGALWDFAERSQATYFGASAAYIAACMKSGIVPRERYDLSRLRGLGSTGSPLPIEGFDWVYQQVKSDLWLGSISGGTDVCTAFVGCCPLQPVTAGELQCRYLGVALAAFDDHGLPVIDTVGELVITEPMPSMPLFFWNDDGLRYRESYFEHYPNIWRHGDWCKVTSRGSVVIYGRSDSTINRMGIRMGTSEIYRAVEGIPEVLDSLVVDLEGLGGTPYMPLFVVLREDVTLNDTLQSRIKATIRATLTARHVPDEIFAIQEIPRTLNGKKLEVPIKKILRGIPPAQAANLDAMANPKTLEPFVALADRLQQSGKIRG